MIVIRLRVDFTVALTSSIFKAYAKLTASADGHVTPGKL